MLGASNILEFSYYLVPIESVPGIKIFIPGFTMLHKYLPKNSNTSMHRAILLYNVQYLFWILLDRFNNLDF